MNKIIIIIIQILTKMGGIFSFIGISLSIFNWNLKNFITYLICLLTFYYIHIKIKYYNDTNQTTKNRLNFILL